MTEPTTSSIKGKTGPIQQCKTQFEWASNHIKSQCKVGNRFIGFDHEHLSRKQKVSMTALTNISVAIPLNTMVILQEEIHTQNAVQVCKRKNAMEIDWWNYTQNLYAATSPDQLLKRKLPTSYVRFVFLMLHTHLQDTRLLLEFTWFYEYCVNLLNLPDRYTLSRPSTPMDGLNWAFNLPLNI